MVEAKVTYLDGLRFVGEASSGHAIVTDGDPTHGGNNVGLRPTELLLIGLGSCSGMGIVSVLRKKKQDVRGLEITLKGEKEEGFPQRFTDIDIEFAVRGRNLSEDAVRRAVELSVDKYCAVKATLDGSAAMNFCFRIVDDDTGASGAAREFSCATGGGRP